MNSNERVSNPSRQNNKSTLPWLVALALSLSACTEKRPKYFGTPIEGYNHTSAAINYFTVDGEGGPNIGPHQGGGGQNCCVTLPVKWEPGLQVVVEWEKDPNAGQSRYWPERFPSKEWTARMEQHRKLYTRHRAVAEVYSYEKLGVVNVHFLPCNQIKVTAGVYGPRHSKYPFHISPRVTEPKTCPAP